MVRQRDLKSTQKRLRQRIDRQFNNTYLKSLGEILMNALNLTDFEVDEATIESQINSVNTFISRLPSGNEERFTFDSEIISAITDFLSSNKEIRFSTPIHPKYGDKWAQAHLLIPSSKPKASSITPSQCVDLIMFPGTGFVEEIDLLNYPWVFHELGHNVGFINSIGVHELFFQYLDEVIKDMMRGALSLQENTKKLTREMISLTHKIWSDFWFNELLADIFACWVSGLAYIECFLDTLSRQEQVKPFLYTDEHPSYSIRLTVLLKLAEYLGLNDQRDKLNLQLSRWEKTSKSDPNWNKLVITSKPELIDKSLEIVTKQFEKIGLPVMNTHRTKEIVKNDDWDKASENGLDLMVLARAKYISNPAGFDGWEETVIDSIAEELK